MDIIHNFKGAFRYEFRMQGRRLAVWATFLLLGLTFIIFHQPWYRPLTSPVNDAIVYWTTEMHMYLAIVVAILLADRLPRDRRTKVEELLDTYASGTGARLMGKFLGSTLATLLPVLVIYTVGVLYILNRWHAWSGLGFALLSFAGIVLPGILFVGAFSIALPGFIWTPLYQFGFIGYWFWGNILPPGIGIPTLSDSIITPVGSSICSGLFNTSHREGVCNPGLQAVTVSQGIASIGALIGIALLVMLILNLILRWQKKRQ